MRYVIFLGVLCLIAACNLTVAPVSNNSICPPVRTYTADQEKKAAAELRALAADSVVAQMIADYGQERAVLRACQPPAKL